MNDTTLNRILSYADSEDGWLGPDSLQINIHTLSRALCLFDKLKDKYNLQVFPFSTGNYLQFEIVKNDVELEIEVYPMFYNICKFNRKTLEFTEYNIINSDEKLIRYLNKILFTSRSVELLPE